MTKLRQAIQINNSETYTDTTSPGAGMEPAFPTSNVEVDLNNIRSMINEIVSSQGGNWYDALAGRDVNQLDVDLTDLEDKTVLCRVSELENVTVGAGNNYAVLTAPGETPSVVAAIGAVSTLGAVCAELPGAPGTGSTVTVAGQNAIQPKNLLTLVDTATGEVPVDSSGAEIYGLLQIENGATDGAAFDNAANQGQISFVVVNATRTGFDLTTDAAGLTVQYAYVSRTTLDLIPEECFIPYAGFVDNSASVEVTLTNAYANQGTGAAPLSTTITSQTDSTNQSWDVVNAAGANIASFGVGAADGNILAILGDAAAAVDSITRINGTDLDVNVTNAATIANGMTFEGTPSIDIGVTDGLIESTAALTLESNSSPLTLLTTTGGNITFTSAAAITGTATTSVSLSTSNAADASGNTVTLTAGNSTAGVAAGAAVVVNTGDGFGAGSGGNFTVNLGSGGGTGVAGFMDVTHGGTDEERVQQLSVTGTGADQIGIFVGASSPNGRVNAGGDIGSLFVDGTAGTMYINTDGGTTWTAFAVGGAESWASTLAVGNVSGGTDAVISVGDVLRGVDGAAPGALNLDGGDATVAATAGAAVNVTGGSGNTSGVGGAASVTGGAAGLTGTGGAASLAGAAGGATSGDGGAVTVDGGAATVGVGGAVTISSGASADGNSGLLTIQVPDATTAGSTADNIEILGGAGGTGAGAADGSNIQIAAGGGGTGSSGGGGDVTIDGGPSGGASSSSGGVAITTGVNSGSNAAGTLTLATTDNNAADAGLISITGGNVTGVAEGGGVNISSGHGATAGTGGSVFIGAAPGSVANGLVTISTNLIADASSQISEADAVLALLNNGAGTGAGEEVRLYTGTSDPTAGGGISAPVGSVFYRDSGGAGTTGEAWLKTGAANTAWELFQTGTGDTSLSEAITLEGAGAFTATNSINWGSADGDFVSFNDSADATLLRVTSNTGLSTSTVLVGSDTDFFDVDAADNNFLNGVAIDTGSAVTTINVGVTANQIDSGGALLITGGDTGLVTLRSANSTTGSAGDVDIIGGNGFTGLGDAPGDVNITGGTAGAGSGAAGGSIAFNGGLGDGVGQGGSITGIAGNAAAVGGLGGSVTFNAGNNPFLANGSGGSFAASAGTAQGATFTAGNATVSAGAGASGALGGTLSLFGGNSDASGETIGSAGAIVGTAGNNTGTDRAGDVSFTAGTNSSAGGEGGRVLVQGGVSAGASASPTFQLIPGSTSGAGANGFVHVNGVNAETEAVFRLSTTGTSGNDASMFVGESDPSAGGGVPADVSSIFFRDSGGAGTTGEAWLKTGAADTAWEQILTGTAGTTSLSAAITAEGAGNFQATNSTSWGNPDGQSVVFTGPGGGGDEILEVNALAAGDTVIVNGGLTVTGDAGAPGQTHSITGGAGAAATNAGGGVNVTGGAGNTTGVGGAIGITGGAGGATGNGAVVAIAGGAGGGTSGNGGGVTVDGGVPTDGNGGGVAIAAADGVGTNRDGGSSSFIAGDATGTGTPGAIAITAGDASTNTGGTVSISSGTAAVSGDGGDITIDAADFGGGGAVSGGDIILDAGDSAEAEGGLVIIRSGSTTTVDSGYLWLDMPNDDDEHIVQLTTGGTNGTTTQLLTGTQNPDTVVNALPGSLYLRRVVAASGSALFVNVSNAAGEGTDWQEVFGNTSRTFVQGVPSGTILSGADVSDIAPAANVTMDFGTFPTFPATQAAFNTRTKIWINGLLQRNGAGLDVIRSGTQATAFQMVSVTLITTDVIQIEQWSA